MKILTSFWKNSNDPFILAIYIILAGIYSFVAGIFFSSANSSWQLAAILAVLFYVLGLGGMVRQKPQAS